MSGEAGIAQALSLSFPFASRQRNAFLPSLQPAKISGSACWLAGYLRQHGETRQGMYIGTHAIAVAGLDSSVFTAHEHFTPSCSCHPRRVCYSITLDDRCCWVYGRVFSFWPFFSSYWHVLPPNEYGIILRKHSFKICLRVFKLNINKIIDPYHGIKFRLNLIKS